MKLYWSMYEAVVLCIVLRMRRLYCPSQRSFTHQGPRSRIITEIVFIYFSYNYFTGCFRSHFHFFLLLSTFPETIVFFLLAKSDYSRLRYYARHGLFSHIPLSRDYSKQRRWDPCKRTNKTDDTSRKRSSYGIE